MAPTFASITPRTGRTGGRYLVTLLGTGFQLPAVPAAAGPVPVAEPSVRVRFVTAAGVSYTAPRVDVLSARQLRVLVPACDAGVVGVVVENINAAGTVLSSATAAQAFTFGRPDLTATGQRSTVVLATRTLLQALKREVLENTSLTVHTEYDASPTDGTDAIEFATLPAIVLSGPRLVTNRMYASNELVQTQDSVDATLAYQERPVRARDIEFDVTVASTLQIELMALMHEVEAFFERNTRLTVGDDTYELQQPLSADFNVTSHAGPDNVRQAGTRCVIRGVPMHDEASVLRALKQLQDALPVGADTTAVVPSPVVLGSTNAGPVGQGGTANPVGDPYQSPPNGLEFEQLEP